MTTEMKAICGVSKGFKKKRPRAEGDRFLTKNEDRKCSKNGIKSGFKNETESGPKTGSKMVPKTCPEMGASLNGL